MAHCGEMCGSLIGSCRRVRKPDLDACAAALREGKREAAMTLHVVDHTYMDLLKKKSFDNSLDARCF